MTLRLSMARLWLVLGLVLGLSACAARSPATVQQSVQQSAQQPAVSPELGAELLARPVLTLDDFEYLGAFAPPRAVGDNPAGGQWSTGFAFGGLALRRVGGELRFFATTHVYSGGLVYEMAFPGLSKSAGQWPPARVVRAWGDIYGGRKRTGAGSALGGGVWTHGLLWDEPRQRLYWSYGPWYNTEGDLPVLGYTEFGSGAAQAQGPWRAPPHAQVNRGGTLRIPAWFAEQYLGGRRLGSGFGGYYSIIGAGSRGPTLYASFDPQPGQVALDTLTLMEFRGEHLATRDADYFTPPGSAPGNVSWMRNPDGGVGYWGAADTVEGAAIWIDTPRKQGVLYFPRFGAGRIGYDAGAITFGRVSNRWSVYDPKVFAAVAQGRQPAWTVEPASTFALAPLDHWDASHAAEERVTGAAFDSQTSVLYLYVYQADRGGAESFPLVLAYRVK